MASNMGPINLSTLDELTFKRSKWWSTFLEEVGKDDSTDACHINEIEEKYRDEFTDEIGRNNINDEAEESDVIEDIEHHSTLKVMTEHERNSFIESSDVQDILNATRPVLEEHDRKWRKAGLDRILNTFDSVRIEKEVGDWMRRNHSSTANNVGYEDPTVSSSSCDTECYIRSTRKNGFRRRSRISAIKKFKNSQKLRHKHGMLIETTMFRAYKCNCCKHKFNRSNQPKWQLPSNEREDLTDTDDSDSDNDPRISVHPTSLRRSRCVPPFRPQYESSTDSDCASPKKLIISRRSLSYPHVEQVFNERDEMCNKHLSNRHPSKKLPSMVEPNNKTPSNSSAVEVSVISTASSRANNKREAAMRALAKMRKSEKLRDKKSHSKKTPNKHNPDECNSTFEKDLKKAIALSLETKAQTQKNNTASKKEDIYIDLTNMSSILSVKSSLSSTTSTSSKLSPKPFRGYLKLPTTQTTPQIFNRATEDTKENTFFANAENICNSTALNGAATRKQLTSRLPPISESTETPHSTTSMLHTASDFRKEKQLKNFKNSNALRCIKSGKELITPKPRQTMLRECVSEPKYRLKRRIPSCGRKSLGATIVSCKLKKLNALKGPNIAGKVDIKQKPERILLYKPQANQQEPCGYIQVTKELLSDVIGEKDACRFMKHHLGRLTFPNTSTIYYCPPEEELSSSDSDDDPLQKVGRCGELYESVRHDENGKI